MTSVHKIESHREIYYPTVLGALVWLVLSFLALVWLLVFLATVGVPGAFSTLCTFTKIPTFTAFSKFKELWDASQHLRSQL